MIFSSEHLTHSRSSGTKIKAKTIATKNHVSVSKQDDILTLVWGLFQIGTGGPTRDVYVPLLASRAATNNPRTAWEPPQRAQSTWRMSYYCTYLNEKKREKNIKYICLQLGTVP